MRMTLEQFMEAESRAKGKPMKPRKPRACRTEHDEQAELIQRAEHVKSREPVLRWLHAIPNGGARAKAVAVKLKAEGVKPGVPDLCLPASRGLYCGLYIEMKSMTGSESREQKDWRNHLCEEGYLAVVCKGAREAIRVLCEYLDLDFEAEIVKWEAMRERVTRGNSVAPAVRAARITRN